MILRQVKSGKIFSISAFLILFPAAHFLINLKGKEQDIEAFIHLGACSDTTESDGDYIMETNYRFSIKLAEYALSHGHRFIYASSAATYGAGNHGFIDDPLKLDELKALKFIWIF